MMHQTGTLKTLVLQMVLLLMVAGCATETLTKEELAGSGAEAGEMEQANGVTAPAGSCAAPARPARCEEMEAQILAATVRLEVDLLEAHADGGYEIVKRTLGHATVMAGRYLVTHNHYSLTLENLNDGKLRRLSAYAPDGSVLVQDAPFHVFDVLVAEPQTLVLDFGTYAGQGALAYNGLASAEFGQAQALGVQPGAEVAQVTWDGTETTVQWVRVADVRSDDGTPVVALDSVAEKGASGGGVFYEGYHVGNNWYRATEEQATTGEVLRRYTVAALNVTALMALPESDARDEVADGSGPGDAEDAPVEMETTDLLVQ